MPTNELTVSIKHGQEVIGYAVFNTDRLPKEPWWSLELVATLNGGNYTIQKLDLQKHKFDE